jgi:hypothetical protein
MWVKGNPGAGSLSHLEGLILGEEKKIATDPRLPYIAPPTPDFHILYVKAFITTIYSTCQEKSPLHAVCDW